MSSTTTNLGLVKMASGETIGQWSDANNGSGGNLDKIDTAVGNLNSQIDPIFGTRNWVTSANLDDYTETGIYMIGATPTNAPSDWGTLQVWAPTSSLVVQTYYRSGAIWTREYRSSDGWYDWVQKAQDETGGSTSYNNLNNMKTTGFYQYAGSSTGAPTTNGGSLICCFGSGGTQGMQIAHPNNQSYLSIRAYNNGTWTNWSNLNLS